VGEFSLTSVKSASRRLPPGVEVVLLADRGFIQRDKHESSQRRVEMALPNSPQKISTRAQRENKAKSKKAKEQRAKESCQRHTPPESRNRCR